jgi:hypothetical protein
VNLTTTIAVFMPDASPLDGKAPTAVCQNGVMDYVLHPIEPLAVRPTLVGSF